MENAVLNRSSIGRWHLDAIPFRVRGVFADPEVKGWRTRRYAELKAECEWQQFYDYTEKLIKETREMLAHNRSYLRTCPPVSSRPKPPPLRQILHDENLPFEIKDGQFNYTGPAGELYNSSFGLMAALADRAPDVLEGSIGDIEFLKATVAGFNDAWNAECYRLWRKNVLVENRVMRSDGALTEKGEDFLAELYGDKRAWSFARDKNAGTVIPLLPTLIGLMVTDEKEAGELCKRTFDHVFGEEKRAAAEAKLKEIVGKEDRLPWYRTRLAKGTIAAGAAALMGIAGTTAVAAADDGSGYDSSPTDHASSRAAPTGFNADAYDYSLPLDQQHPISQVQGKGWVRGVQPGLYEDRLAYVTWANGSHWELRLMDVQTGEDKLLVNMSGDGSTCGANAFSRVAFYGNRIAFSSGFRGGSDLYELDKDKFSSCALDPGQPDLWGDKLVGRQNFLNSTLVNLTSGQKTTLAGVHNSAVYENKLVIPVLRNDTYLVDLKVIDLDSGKNVVAPVGMGWDFWAGNPLDVYGDLAVVSTGTHKSPVIVNLKDGSYTKLVSGPVGPGTSNGYLAFNYAPQIYEDRIVWPHDKDGEEDPVRFKVMHLDKWLPQLRPIPDLNATADQPFYIDFKKYFSDPDSPSPTFSDDSPLLDVGPSTGEGNFTPKTGDIGTHYVNITFTDQDGNKVTRQAKLIVNPAQTSDIELEKPPDIYPAAVWLGANWPPLAGLAIAASFAYGTYRGVRAGARKVREWQRAREAADEAWLKALRKIPLP